LTIGPRGGIAREARLAFPDVEDSRRDSFGYDPRLGGIAGGVTSDDGKKLYAVTTNGRVFVVDVESETLSDLINLDLPQDRIVSVGPELADERLYLGLGRFDSDDVGRADRLLVVSLRDWEIVDNIASPHPFVDFALGPGENVISAIDQQTRSLVLFDRASLEEEGVYRGLGGTPGSIEVPSLGQR
jgi:hypothetical protein